MSLTMQLESISTLPDDSEALRAIPCDEAALVFGFTNDEYIAGTALHFQPIHALVSHFQNIALNGSKGTRRDAVRLLVVEHTLLTGAYRVANDGIMLLETTQGKYVPDVEYVFTTQVPHKRSTVEARSFGRRLLRHS